MRSRASSIKAQRSSHLSRVHAAMLAIEEARNLYEALPTTHTGRLGDVEGIALELAHQLEAGRNFAWRLEEGNLDGLFANGHEASALRIEVSALRVLGVRVSLCRLWRDAGWRGDPPPLEDRPLTVREHKCVDAFVRIVRRAMDKSASTTKERR